MKKIQVDNIQWLINEYGGMLFSGAYIVGVDHYEELMEQIQYYTILESQRVLVTKES